MATDCGEIIFVVDDDAGCRRQICDVLRAAGYSTFEAETAEEALEEAADRRPAAVLLDVQLPGMSGYEACRRLREMFGHALPVVIVSGERAEPSDRVAGLLPGADDYVVKPFVPDELLARVRGLVERTAALAGHQSSLTKREQQVLSLLAEGRRQEQIAAELVITPKTVGKHIEHILAKLGVHSRAEAVALAARDYARAVARDGPNRSS